MRTLGRTPRLRTSDERARPGMLLASRRGSLVLRVLVVVAVLAAPAPPPPPPLPSVRPSMVGFSFSPKVALDEHIDPQAGLRRLLSELHPDLVRLPIYWDQTEPQPGRLDFSQTDAMLAVIADHNAAGRGRSAKVLLVVGARNLGNPEAHVPSWAFDGQTPLRGLASTSEYQGYLKGAFTHFAASPLLFAWQVENEPLDNTNPWLGDVALPAGTVKDEISRLKQIDRGHLIVVTTYNSATTSLDQMATSRFNWLWNLLPGPRPVGHPPLALSLGDVLGLDAYVVTPATPLNQASAEQRIAWKREALSYWSQQASSSGKQLWITEMQGAPWDGVAGFSLANLMQSARGYRSCGASVVLLWGVESWLISPDWMAHGQQAMDVLRGASVSAGEVVA